MRRCGLGILATVSLLIGMAVASGYFSYSSIGYKGLSTCVTMVDGRVVVIWKIVASQWPTDNDWLFSAECVVYRPNGRWLWGFESIPTPRIIAFPIWCLLVPCSIPPILWLRKRRRLPTRGFPVEPAAAAGRIE